MARRWYAAAIRGRVRAVAFSLAILSGLVGAGPATAHSINALATSTTNNGPGGWLALCARLPDTCAVSGEATVSLDAPQRAWLQQINAYVNHTIRPVRDPAGGDHWDIGVRQGDCEEFALAKRQALLQAGYPAGALRLAVAERNGEFHAVLTVETTAGTLVLDNLRDDVEPFEALPYLWVLLERKDRPATWSILQPTPVTVAASLN